MDSQSELARLLQQLNDPEVVGRRLYWGEWWLPKVRARIQRRIVKLKEEMNLSENRKAPDF